MEFDIPTVESTRGRIEDLIPNSAPWLAAPNERLQGIRPIDLLHDDPNRLRLLNAVLDQIEYGIFT